MSEPEVPVFTRTSLATLSARLVSHRWAWAEANAAMIAANWERRRAATPGLFDGIVLLACGCTISGGHCQVDFFEVRYSRFIAFRDAGSPDPAVANAFAAIVPRTADGAVLLGQMAPGTANAGQVYFPCGTPDAGDVRDGGVVDLAGSAEREFREETGLTLPASAAQAPWTLLQGDGQLAFLRPVRLDETAEQLGDRMERHRLQDADPELARVVIARGAQDIDGTRMPPFARAYLAAAFAGVPAVTG